MPTSDRSEAARMASDRDAAARVERIRNKQCVAAEGHDPPAMGSVMCGRCQLEQAYGAESPELAAFDQVRRERAMWVAAQAVVFAPKLLINIEGNQVLVEGDDSVPIGEIRWRGVDLPKEDGYIQVVGEEP